MSGLPSRSESVAANPGPARLEPEGDLIDFGLLRDWALFVLRAPLRHKLIAVASFLAVSGAAAGALKVLPKKYEVRAAVLAQPNPLFLEYNQFDAPTRAARETVLRRENVIALLKQTDFVARHAATRAPAAKLKADVMRLLQGPPTPEQQLEEAANAVDDRLQVTVAGDGTVEFRFEWSNAELTFDVVEAAIHSFLEARFAREVLTIGETIALLEEHAKRLSSEIAEKTKSVEALEREIGSKHRPKRVVVIRTPARVPRDEAGAELEARLVAKKRGLAEIEEFRQRRVAELQAQLMQQSTIYTERHPIVESTRRSLEAANSPSPQLESLRGEVSQLERELSRRGTAPSDVVREQPFSGNVPDVASDSTEDPRLEHERYTLRLVVRQHSMLLERTDAARFQMDTARAGFKYRYSVIKPPQMPKGPVRPRPAKILAAGVVGGVFFAFFACVALDLWSGRLVEISQVRRQLGVPLLGGARGRV